ncbi:alkaline phosphatase PhoX [Lysobacter sp. A289]
MADFDLSRRQILKGSAAAMAMAAIGSLGALYSRQALAAASGDAMRLGPIAGPYGALAPVADSATGLELLQLPPGFSYTSLGWAGDLMDDGQPVPDRHDGMAVLQPQREGGGNELVIVRNHERGIGTPIKAPGMYDTGLIGGGVAGGGTTNLTWRDGKLQAMEASLGGTLINCAGGPTPWGTWLSCEEVSSNEVSADGNKHGYVFEVDPDPARTSGRPIIGMGRFSHEAVAVDPRTGYVYLTEDDRNKSGLYRYVPDDTSGRNGSLANGGRLQAARVQGRRNADLCVAAIGDRYQLEWVDIDAPDLDNLVAPASFPDIDPGDTLSGPFAQAWTQGALRMSRGEGIWHAGDSLFIVDTSTGMDDSGRKGHGRGAVWVLDLPSQTLRALFVSGNQLAANNPDNVTVSPRGGVVLCEDGGESLDQYGPGARVLGLTGAGESFYLAKNNAELTSSQIAGAGKQVAEGDYRRGEFCGACWDPAGETLFVNIQTPGITLAITGPWQHGGL